MITHADTDARLLERFAGEGQDSAFAELVERHGPRVGRICRRILPNEHDAEEVFQATFLLLARKLQSVRWHDSIEGWLCAVARRLAWNCRAASYRRRLRERPYLRSADAGHHCLPSDLPESCHPSCDPFEEIHRRDVSRLLQGALGDLPEKYKAAIELCYMEGKTNDEAARALGWPAGSMSRRLSRARTLLRHRLVHMGLVVMLCGACAAAVYLHPLHVKPMPVSQPMAARSPMHAFHAVLDDQVSLPTALERLVQGRPAPASREQLAALSRTAEWVAMQSAPRDAGERNPLWSTQVETMRVAAVELGAAARVDDRLAMVDAVRRLGATCLACHDVFQSEMRTPR